MGTSHRHGFAGRRLIPIVASAAAAAVALFIAVRPAASPAAAQPAAGMRLLLLTHNAFYKHSSLHDIETAVPELGKIGGFRVTSLEGYKQAPDKIDLSMMTGPYLSQFDAVMVSTNGELPMSDAGMRALVEFVRNGRGFIAVHQSVVTFYTFPAWGEMLGAYFSNGPIFDAVNKAKRLAVLKVEDRNHPATRKLPDGWTLHDEFYQFARKAWDPATPTENLGPTGHPVPMAFSRDRVHVLLSIDSMKTDFTGAPEGWVRGGDYPQAWYQYYGKGRTFYTSLGHRDDLWSADQTFREHILGALRWGLGLEK